MTGPLCLRYVPAVVRAHNGGGRIALKLRCVLLRGHNTLSVAQLVVGKNCCLGRPQYFTEPTVFFRLRRLVLRPKLVAALHRPDDDGPSTPVRKSRSNNLPPQRRGHVCELIQDNAIKRQTTQPVRIIAAIQTNARPIN